MDRKGLKKLWETTFKQTKNMLLEGLKTKKRTTKKKAKKAKNNPIKRIKKSFKNLPKKKRGIIAATAMILIVGVVTAFASTPSTKELKTPTTVATTVKQTSETTKTETTEGATEKTTDTTTDTTTEKKSDTVVRYVYLNNTTANNGSKVDGTRKETTSKPETKTPSKSETTKDKEEKTTSKPETTKSKEEKTTSKPETTKGKEEKTTSKPETTKGKEEEEKEENMAKIKISIFNYDGDYLNGKIRILGMNYNAEKTVNGSTTLTLPSNSGKYQIRVLSANGFEEDYCQKFTYVVNTDRDLPEYIVNIYLSK